MSTKKGKKILDRRRQWIIATVIGCFIFPVGFVWLLALTVWEARRSIEQNRTILHCGIGAIIWGLFMSIPFLLFGQTSGSPMPFAAYTAYIGAFLLGVYLLILYGVLALRNRKLRRCLLLVQQEHITSLPMIAEIMGLSREKTVKLFMKLFSLGFLDGAYISDDGQELQFKKSVWAKQRVICRSCGAELVVNMGHTLTCEYCGGALQPGYFHRVKSDGTLA